MSVMFISIFFLPFVAVALAGVVFAIVRSLTGASSAAPARAGRGPGSVLTGLGVAVGVVVLVFILLGVMGVFVFEPHVKVVSEARIEPPVVTPAPPAAYEWNQAMSREPSLPRDPHTSMKTLKAYMAASVETALGRVGDEGARPWLVVPDKKVPKDLVSELCRSLNAELVVSPTGQVPGAGPVVRVRWTEPPSSVSVPSFPQPMRQGTLVADVTGPHGNESVKATLKEKPWLEHAPAPSGDWRFVVVTSDEPTAPTREEAINRLNQAKTTAVANMVEPQVAALSSQWHARPDDVRTQVMARYGDAGTPFDDEVVMRIDRPTGPVWYAAGLVRVSTGEISRMAQSAQTVSDDRHAGWAKMLGGAGGMLLVLLVLYAIMNAITRGYFRAHLRTAVAIVLALAVVMMFLRMA